MTDMLGVELHEGDFVLYAGGNARYGGLKMILGLVVGVTPKRVKLLTSPLEYDNKPLKATNKTGKKVVVTITPTIVNSESARALEIAADYI